MEWFKDSIRIPSTLCLRGDLTYSLNGVVYKLHQDSTNLPPWRRSYLFIEWSGLQTPSGFHQSSAMEENLSTSSCF